MHGLLLDLLPVGVGPFAFAHAWCADALRRWRARRQARAIAQALATLDDRTLRELGFERGELGASVAELHGLVAPTRWHVAQADRRC
jgi:uncharacterized protein YjiS (DUF1127 family)